MENRDIQQYSLEWYKEMRKLNKDTIISLVESNGKQRDSLKEQNKALLDDIEKLKKLHKQKVENIGILNKDRHDLFDKIDRLKFQLKAADSINEKSTIMLGLIHDIVDKQNFNEDSDLHKIYKITHNSF